MTDNPFNYWDPMIGEQYIGRKEEVEKVARGLAQQRRSCVIVGGRKCGKTSFLKTLQDTLLKRLAQAQVRRWHILPVFVNLRDLSQYSTGSVFALMVHTLYNYFHSPLQRQNLNLTLEFDVSGTQVEAFVQSKAQECHFHCFTTMLEELILNFFNVHGLLRIVFLLDETGKILEQFWARELFSQLRSLLDGETLRQYLCFVLAGSSKLREKDDYGSPLWNVNEPVYLTPLKDAFILEILQQATTVPDDFATAVLQLCKGHPYLAQYVMYCSWENLQQGRVPALSEIENRFRTEHIGDLAQWKADVGEAGLLVYDALITADNWLSEPEIKQRIHDQTQRVEITAALTNLWSYSLILRDNSWKYRVGGTLFQNWFTENIRPSLRSHIPASTSPLAVLAGEPDIHIDFHTRIFPVAYWHALTVERFPLVQCRIDNTRQGCTDARVVIEATIQGFGEPSSLTLDVPASQSKDAVLLPTLRLGAVAKLTEEYKAVCHVVIKRLAQGAAHILYDESMPLSLQGHNVAFIAFRDEQGKPQNLADYLAVFVTPRTAKMCELVGIAGAVHHPHKTINGYQGARNILIDTRQTIDLEDARRISRLQAQAFFLTLAKNAKLHYVNSAINLEREPGSLAQYVRLPDVSVSSPTGQCNCLDAAILFASLLENVGMEPFIALTNTHAFVGWRIWAGIDHYDFLETTMIPQGNFNRALEEGNRQYKRALALQQQDPARTLLDPAGFLYLVDIHECRTRKKIQPLLL
jgi:hypothetical protein